MQFAAATVSQPLTYDKVKSDFTHKVRSDQPGISNIPHGWQETTAGDSCRLIHPYTCM